MAVINRKCANDCDKVRRAPQETCRSKDWAEFSVFRMLLLGYNDSTVFYRITSGEFA